MVVLVITGFDMLQALHHNLVNVFCTVFPTLVQRYIIVVITTKKLKLSTSPFSISNLCLSADNVIAVPNHWNPDICLHLKGGWQSSKTCMQMLPSKSSLKQELCIPAQQSSKLHTKTAIWATQLTLLLQIDAACFTTLLT